MDSFMLLLSENTSYKALILTAATVITILLYLEFNSRKAGLSHVPGPFLARYTALWGVYAAWHTNRHDNRVPFQRRLQARYGDNIRTGPRTVMVLDPAAVQVIYGVRSRLDKGDAYIPFRQEGVARTLVSIPDERTHSQYRKLVSNAYSMSSLKGYEPNIDDVLSRFAEICDGYAKTGGPMNLSLWCHYYCFDVVAKVTIGKALGFLNGNDVCGLVKAVKTYGFYLELVTQMPSLHKFLLGNPLFSGSRESPFLTVVKSSIQDRLRDPDPQGQPRPDLLSHFVATHEEYPQLMDNKYLAISTSSNLVAGGLSPGKAFDCLCHYLVTNPELQDKLFAELQEAHISLPVSYDKAKALPYLEGTIREAYRFIDPANANLQRVTGAGGLELPDGCRLPPNTNVGCPTSFIAQEPRAFGSDAHHFKPERWMQGENESYEVYLERRKLMNKSDLTFGHGSRSCVGKNIAELELYKAAATLIAQFTFKLAGELKKGEVIVTVQRRGKVIGSQT